MQDDRVLIMGGCPTCHSNDGFANAGSTHIVFCREHRTRWIWGANLSDTWKFETEDEQRELYYDIGLDTFTGVEPWFPPREPGRLGSFTLDTDTLG